MPHGEDAPRVAAAYAVDDPRFEGTQHGIAGSATLCGLPRRRFVIVRNLFLGTGARDCRECADALRHLADEGRGHA